MDLDIEHRRDVARRRLLNLSSTLHFFLNIFNENLGPKYDDGPFFLLISILNPPPPKRLNPGYASGASQIVTAFWGGVDFLIDLIRNPHGTRTRAESTSRNLPPDHA